MATHAWMKINNSYFQWWLGSHEEIGLAKTKIVRQNFKAGGLFIYSYYKSEIMNRYYLTL